MANVNEADLKYQSVGDNSFFEIKALTSQQLEIFNLTFGGACELYKTNGTTDILVETFTQSGGLFNYKLFVSDTIYYRIKNKSGATKYFGYEGVRIV